MPRYFFHVILGPVNVPDYCGAELPNETAARGRAIEDIIAVWRSSTVRKRSPFDCAVVVAMNENEELFRVPFVEALGVLPQNEIRMVARRFRTPACLSSPG